MSLRHKDALIGIQGSTKQVTICGDGQLPRNWGYAPSATPRANPPGCPLDISQAVGFFPAIIPPVVSTPGARPPQGGLCYFRKP